jgi:hypothetical protein
VELEGNMFKKIFLGLLLCISTSLNVSALDCSQPSNQFTSACVINFSTNYILHELLTSTSFEEWIGGGTLSSPTADCCRLKCLPDAGFCASVLDPGCAGLFSSVTPAMPNCYCKAGYQNNAGGTACNVCGLGFFAFYFLLFPFFLEV